MFTVDCDVCGKSIWIYTWTEGFKVCGRCLNVHKKTGTPLAELVSENLAAVEEAKSGRNFRSNVGCLLLLFVIGAGAYACIQVTISSANLVALFYKSLTPVKVSCRDSLIASGVVFRIQNVGQGSLVNLTVTLLDSVGKNTGQQHVFTVVQPGETVEAGALEFGFPLAVDTRFFVSAEGFLPREFNKPEEKTK